MGQRKHDEKGIRIKFKRGQIIFLSVLVTAAVLVFLYDIYSPKPITEINYDGVVLKFRADLREAKNIKVYPNEQALYGELMNPLIENITIAVKPAGEQNPIYSIQAVELATKLEIAYLKLGLDPYFNRQPLIVESYENLTGEPEKPIIALVHPLYSDETIVRVENNVVFVKAKDYKGFDLAVVKLLMVALRIKI